MVSELDSSVTSQLYLFRGMHTIAKAAFAHYRELLMKEKLLLEAKNLPMTLELAHGFEAVNRWHELAESVTPEKPQW